MAWANTDFVIFAYNSTVHKTIGYAPFQLMFGSIPKLPVDVVFAQALHDPVIVDYGSYTKTLEAEAACIKTHGERTEKAS